MAYVHILGERVEGLGSALGCCWGEQLRNGGDLVVVEDQRVDGCGVGVLQEFSHCEIMEQVCNGGEEELAVLLVSYVLLPALGRRLWAVGVRQGNVRTSTASGTKYAILQMNPFLASQLSRYRVERVV